MQQFEETSTCFNQSQLAQPATHISVTRYVKRKLTLYVILFFHTSMEHCHYLDAHQRTRAEHQPKSHSHLGAFTQCRPEVDILPGKAWKCSMRSAFY